MDAVAMFHASHPVWVWLIIAAGLLAIELATGSGWLLWPAACAAVVGVLTLVLPLGAPVEVVLFALSTIASTVLSRRFLKPVLDSNTPDLNDPLGQLIGREGEVLGLFEGDRGRVFVDGKEWQARLEGPPPSSGQRIAVIALDGATLTVRAC
jgi:membrane protein implicated in regulation of membrane protease activity